MASDDQVTSINSSSAFARTVPESVCELGNQDLSSQQQFFVNVLVKEKETPMFSMQGWLQSDAAMASPSQVETQSNSQDKSNQVFVDPMQDMFSQFQQDVFRIEE